MPLPIVLLARYTKDFDCSPNYGIDGSKYRGLCFLRREYKEGLRRCGVYYSKGRRGTPRNWSELDYYMFALREDQYEVCRE
jgi:hypothetical protein